MTIRVNNFEILFSSSILHNHILKGVRDRPLFFYREGGVTIFGTCIQFFSKE